MSRDRYEHDDTEPYVVIEKHEGSVGSFLIGIAVGAGVALLLAPRSGAETRQAIGDGARRARERAEDVVGGVTDTVTDGFRQARDEVEGRIDAARGAVEMRRQQVVSAVEAGRDAAKQARADLERRIAETKAAYQAASRTARAGGTVPRTTGTVASAGDEGLTPRGRATGGRSGITAAGDAGATHAAQPVEVDPLVMGSTGGTVG